MPASPSPRAAYYISHFGSADAALKAIEQPGHNDASERAICTELRSLRHAEWTSNAANAASDRAAA